MASLFNKENEARIVSAIHRSELLTSGEIRVHVEKRCAHDPVKRAEEVFTLLGMHKTEERNGILFYLAEDDKKFAVIGDEGIHLKVGPEFWNEVRNEMAGKFKLSQFTDGIIKGIEMTGTQLGKYFPHKGKKDNDELSNDVSFG